ncbi:hypothetical protein [Geomonas subterranea]|uniref:hypothetical protein n=1 Tax=Geomonas subterranea TaxID=2847989 RepID=UPI001CD66B0A|nr:hypothetical protein [Geomonas fuzhouensis]
MSNKYPFRSAALAKQTVIESNPTVYPFREATTQNPAEPRLIEDKQDVLEMILTLALFAAICVGLLLLVELMYPGWSIPSLEVIHG